MLFHVYINIMSLSYKLFGAQWEFKIGDLKLRVGINIRTLFTKGILLNILSKELRVGDPE